MTKEQLKYLHNYLYMKYKDKALILFEDCDEDSFGSYIQSKIIVLPKKIKSHQTEWTLFAFLHEIGHIMTNTTKMKRCEQEYRATQWAIDEAKRIGFSVPKSYIYTYQDYIFRWRNTGIKLKAKSIPSEKELTLIY